MPRFTYAQESFIGGEISPKARGRVNSPIYKQALAEAVNAIVGLEGGIGWRPGSQFKRQTQGNSVARLIPFVYSEDEAYVVSLTHNAIRVINVDDGTVSTPISAGGIPYTSVQIAEVQYVQSADTLYLVHPSGPPRTLIRTNTNTFGLTFYNNIPLIFTPTTTLVKTFPFMDSNTTSTTITPSGMAFGAPITLTASSAIFSSLHVGTVFKISHGSSTGAAYITGYTSPTVVSATVCNAFNATTASSNWEEAAWSYYRGWPRSVEFFKGRLIWGGNEYFPDTIWGSAVNNFTHLMAKRFLQDSTSDSSGLNYFGAINDADPISATLASQKVNAIQWLSAKEVLTVGTLGAEYTNDSILATQPIAFTQRTQHGSVYVQPAKAYGATLFAQANGRKIRQFNFNFEADSYVALDLSKFAEHMAGRAFEQPAKFTAMAWQESAGRLWCVDDTGGLCSMTWDRQEGFAAWQYHVLGGSTMPFVHSVAVVPSPDGMDDNVWISVTRIINGSPYISIEMIGPEFKFNAINHASAINDNAPFFLDAAVYSDTGGAASTAVGGLTHLEGEEVYAIADGFVQGPFTVSSGAITLDQPAVKTVVGLRYTPRIRLLKPEAGSATGTSQGSIQRVDRLTVRFVNTMACKYGQDVDTLDSFEIRTVEDDISEPIPMFTGDKTVEFPGDADRDFSVILSSVQPLPCYIAGIFLRGDTRDA